MHLHKAVPVILGALAPLAPCWPSRDRWNALNSSIDGNLVAVRPLAYVCKDPTFDPASCDVALAKANNSVWRASSPGAVQWTNWEAWPERNQTCYFDTPRSIPCGQGRISLFSAIVEKAEHIQAAVRFAAEHKLRLAIKSSGHCFLGRSTAPDSLQISTNRLKGIQFVDEFRPDGAPDSASSDGTAVTIGSGVSLQELYSAVAKKGLAVVAGLSHTVGAAGGYIQGGGHSPLSNWKGMASDNALQFTVVTAQGRLVKANRHQHQDLFWALRGGGGGTFGVVVDVTVRTYPDVPVSLADFGFAVPKGNASAYWDMTRDFHAHLATVSGAGGCGYYTASTRPKVQNGTEVMVLSGYFFFPNETSEARVRTAMDPLLQAMARHALPDSMFQVTPIPRFSQFLAGELKDGFDPTGGTLLLGSRLVSREFLDKHDGPARLSHAMQSVSDAFGSVGFTGHVVAGGAVADSRVDSALNPAWRRTLSHVAWGVDWNSTTSIAEQKAIRERLTDAVARLRDLEPDMGAYLNEANAYEQDFQRSFWGANYKRLYAIKQKLDPRGLFIVRSGVGSEDWDDAGLCRVDKGSDHSLWTQ
ncbi:GTP-binding protein SAS1 [Purpureocillium lavendulum]|uniref:GTP-binding protein SAS1 n=1 Tax=Purpureocillium lavendulum TaxID=1247861 RepID=A0AB34G7A3_9HYPO|nr:GTP-binding protein SAS1 [Purpureocillium lavendulum]